MIHYLKTDPLAYDAVSIEAKKFEIRLNDRNFLNGDVLILKRTKYTGAEMKAGKPLEYTGQMQGVQVTYIMSGPIYGLSEQWVIMSIKFRNVLAKGS